MNAFLIIDAILLLIAAITAIAVIRVSNLFSATLLMGFFSLIMALIWTNMNAMDVAFTEAAVGAGISTLLLLGALVVTGRSEKVSVNYDRFNWMALLIVTITGGALIYGTVDMPAFGDRSATIHQHRARALMRQSVGKIDRPEDRGHIPETQKGWAALEKRSQDHEQLVEEHFTPHLVENLGEEEIADWQMHDDFAHHVPNTVTTLLASYRGYDTMFETAVIFTAGAGMTLLLRRRRDDDDPSTRAKIKTDRES